MSERSHFEFIDNTLNKQITSFDGIKALRKLGKIIEATEHGMYVIDRNVHLLTPAEVDAALETDATARRIIAKKSEIIPGAMVGVRLNVNVKKNTGICVHSIHRGHRSDGYKNGKGFWNGAVLSYKQTITLKHAYFNVHQKGREDIASKRCNKYAIASVDGELVSFADDVTFGGIEISFEPMAMHLFVDGQKMAIWFAENVTLIGNRAYARGLVVYHTSKSAPLKVGETKSCAKVFKLA